MQTSPPDSQIELIPNFIHLEATNVLWEHLLNDIRWEQHHINLFGKQLASPRLSAWHGDPEANYHYSGQQLTPNPWTTQLLSIRSKINKQLDLNFNSVLLNYYRTGCDNIGWHADDEKILGENPTIASLSLGANRRFVIKHKYRKDLPKYEYRLENGDLLIMSGPTQHFWKHQIPKTRKPIKPRINLTFRKIKIDISKSTQY